MGLVQAMVGTRLASRKDPLRLVQSTTEQDPEQNTYQVLDRNGKVVFAGTLEEVNREYASETSNL
jgi:hypothetical protein